MKKIKWVVALFLISAAFIEAQDTPEPERVISWNFDWDDNVIHMPTKVVLLPKGKGREILIKPSELGKIVPELGKPGPYENYEFNPEKGSLRNFYDLEKNNFLADIHAAVKGRNWQAPAWEKFRQSLAVEDSARWVTVITGRGHAAEKMEAGLKYLRDKGHIVSSPKAENIFNVGRLAPFADRAKAKAEVIIGLLDKVSQVPSAPASGSESSPPHVWCYSDDEFKSLQAIHDVLAAHVQKGRWPNVKVILWISGTVPDKDLPLVKAFQGRPPEYAAGFAVVTPEGPRPLSLAELVRFPK